MSRILVVDDEIAVLEVLGGLLEQLGHDVVPAVSGREALALYGRMHVDLILSDVLMEGMDGFELLARLRPRIDDRTPFVIVSSHDDAEGIQSALYAGAFDYVVKPIDPQTLEHVVTRALEAGKAMAGSRG